jgi:hypothetical protein
MTMTEHGATFVNGSIVKVNRLKDGWTWNVSVTANDNTAEEVRNAKNTALQISNELYDELVTNAEEDAEKDPNEVPF